MPTYPQFPRLSRSPALKTKGSYAIDPTLRDPLENGMETSRAKFTRPRRQYTVTFEHMTWADVAKLRYFVEKVAVYGANSFFFTDSRNKRNPVQLLVRFSKLPTEDDEDWVADQFRQKIDFELRESWLDSSDPGVSG